MDVQQQSMPQQSVRRDVLTALQQMFVRQMSVRRDVLTDLQQMFARHDVLASQQQMLITALQQLMFIPTMQQQMITMTDVHLAAADVRHDLAAAVDDPHHHAAVDVHHHLAAAVVHPGYPGWYGGQGGDYGGGGEEEESDCGNNQVQPFWLDLITLYCTCFARCHVVVFTLERQINY